MVHDHDVRRFDEGVDAKDIVQDGLDATACVAHEYGFCYAISRSVRITHAGDEQGDVPPGWRLRKLFGVQRGSAHVTEACV